MYMYVQYKYINSCITKQSQPKPTLSERSSIVFAAINATR